MPTERKDLGYTEWTQFSIQFSQKIKSLAVKKKNKTRLEGLPSSKKKKKNQVGRACSVL